MYFLYVLLPEAELQNQAQSEIGGKYSWLRLKLQNLNQNKVKESQLK